MENKGLHSCPTNSSRFASSPVSALQVGIPDHWDELRTPCSQLSFEGLFTMAEGWVLNSGSTDSNSSDDGGGGWVVFGRLCTAPSHDHLGTIPTSPHIRLICLSIALPVCLRSFFVCFDRRPEGSPSVYFLMGSGGLKASLASWLAAMTRTSAWGKYPTWKFSLFDITSISAHRGRALPLRKGTFLAKN